MPAAVTPDGVSTLATAIGKCGSVYGARWRRAWRSSNQSVFIVTGSVALEQRHDRVERLVHALALRAGLDAHHVGVGHERARARSPSMARPRVMWSSWTKRLATSSGWWYGRLVTPEPSMM